VQEGVLESIGCGIRLLTGSISEAIGLRCNVTSWEDQVHLFQTAFDTFGSVDVVVCRGIRYFAHMKIHFLQVANAGVNEIGDYLTPKVKNGKPEKPTVATVDVNLLGTIYSERSPIDRVRHNHLILIYPSRTHRHALFGTRPKAERYIEIHSATRLHG
jgi:hypothetical protein